MIVWIEVMFTKLQLRFNVKKDNKIIPEGLYCYSYNCDVNTEQSKTIFDMDVNICKYYRWLPGLNAGCTYVGFIGWDPCLGDQCKICSVKYGLNKEDYVE